MTEDKKGDNNITKAQADFLQYCREINYGVIKEVIIQNGEPVRAKEALKERKFG